MVAGPCLVFILSLSLSLALALALALALSRSLSLSLSRALSLSLALALALSVLSPVCPSFSVLSTEASWRPLLLSRLLSLLCHDSPPIFSSARYKFYPRAGEEESQEERSICLATVSLNTEKILLPRLLAYIDINDKGPITFQGNEHEVTSQHPQP